MTIANLHAQLLRAQLVIIDNGSGDGVKLDADTDVGGFIGKFLPIAIGIGISSAVILVALAGYRLLMSGGDAAKIKDASEQIQNAVLGLMLIIAAVSISVLIVKTLGIDISKL
ncbi:hypothetical protein IT418_01140 [bacterium]|nr:hypothetical protein [bacterium]